MSESTGIRHASSPVVAQLVTEDTPPTEPVRKGPAKGNGAPIAPSQSVTQNPATQQLLKIAAAQKNLGIEYVNISLQDGGPVKFKEAIEPLRAALKIYTREKNPLEYAETQRYLGIALVRLGMQENITEKLNEAVVALREALKIYTSKNNPWVWSDTQEYLAFALMYLGDREDEREKYQEVTVNDREYKRDKYQEALAAFDKALKGCSLKNDPVRYAEIQNNRGVLLTNIAKGRSVEKIFGLDKALAAFDVTIEEFEKAIAAFDEALKVHNYNSNPLEWAKVKLNQSIAFVNLGMRLDVLKGDKLDIHKDVTEKFQKALTAANDASKVYGRETAPREWAQTQYQRGMALEMLGRHENNIDTLKEAADTFRIVINTGEIVPPGIVELSRQGLNYTEALIVQLKGGQK